ncbi:MAG: MFS transporter [Planctomycetes bacterium]|nr:MFS transporter [Planctomycetota bacterium]
MPLSVQAGYSVAEVGLNLVETMLRLYALVFYTDEVGLDAGLAALAIGIAIVWDAITDPIMGVISDRLRPRFGGRRCWLLPGAVWLALGVLALFRPPGLDGQLAKFVWLLLAYCFLNTGMTVLGVPYTAMAGEITADPHGRATLFGWRFAGANLGALAAAALPALFLAGSEGGAAALPAASVVAAAAVVLTAASTWRATRHVRWLEPPPTDAARPDTVASVLGNRAFRPLLAAYVVATVGIGVNAATFLYYYEHRLRLSAVQTQTVLVVFLAVFTLSIAAWVAVARRWGKRRPVVFGAGVLGLGTTALYLVAGAGDFALVLSVGAVGLAAFVGCIVLIEAMLTDVLDHDLVRTRQLRSGAFFGIWRFASKLARAVSVGVVGLVLDLAGYVEGDAAQPASVESALVVLFGPGVGAMFVLAAVVLARQRFDGPKLDQVRRILARRRRRSSRVESPAGAVRQ